MGIFSELCDFFVVLGVEYFPLIGRRRLDHVGILDFARPCEQHSKLGLFDTIVERVVGLRGARRRHREQLGVFDCLAVVDRHLKLGILARFLRYRLTVHPCEERDRRKRQQLGL